MTAPAAPDPVIRPTPFALGLPGEAWANERFRAIADEAAHRGVDPTDPDAFLLLAQVGATLAELSADGEGVVERFGAFLYHAFHLYHASHLDHASHPPGEGEKGEGEERGDALLVEVGSEAARALVAPAPTDVEAETVAEDAAPRPDHRAPPVDPDSATASRAGFSPLPASSGYLRFPRHLVWARPAGAEEPAEAVDGISWVAASGERLALLAVTGVRDDRPGFSILPVPAVPLDDALAWADREARPSELGLGADFDTTLPGGQLGRLHSIETPGEVLKLAARVFRHMGAPAITLEPLPPASEGLDARLHRVQLAAPPASHPGDEETPDAP